jgi:hypothetical protein
MRINNRTSLRTKAGTAAALAGCSVIQGGDAMRYRALVWWMLGALLAIGAGSQPAKADPYQWCAEYGGRAGGGGGTNCYFVTWEQCQAALSGNGGFCRRNLFYSGPNGDERRAHRGQRRRAE